MRFPVYDMNLFFNILSTFLRRADAQGGNQPLQAPRDNLFTEEPPDLIELLIVVARVFNILVFSAGVVFVAMLFLSAYKFSISQGDPKGIEGAKKTLTHALIGFLIVVGAYSLLSLIVASLGGYESQGTMTGLFGTIRYAIGELNSLLGIGGVEP
jgi:hypothetical protein